MGSGLLEGVEWFETEISELSFEFEPSEFSFKSKSLGGVVCGSGVKGSHLELDFVFEALGLSFD